MPNFTSKNCCKFLFFFFVFIFLLLFPFFVKNTTILAVQDPICKTDSGYKGINTALGCIPLAKEAGGVDEGDLQSFLGWILSWTIGICGGIAFVLIIYSGFIIMTSAGDPKRTAAGKELLTAAISGLILILFSVYILELFKVDIFKLQ